MKDKVDINGIWTQKLKNWKYATKHFVRFVNDSTSSSLSFQDNEFLFDTLRLTRVIYGFRMC